MPLGVRCRRPDDAKQDAPHGQWKRPVTKFNPNTGEPTQVMKLVCEECWEAMPNYVESHSGWVSPDSTVRVTEHEGHPGVKAAERLVCYECWRQVWERMNPPGLCETPSWDHSVRE